MGRWAVHAATLFTRKRNTHLVAKGVPRASVRISTLWLKDRCVLFGGRVVSIQTHACTHTRVVVVSEVELILVSSTPSRSLML